MTQAATAAPAMALAGVTPLSVCAPEFTPFGAAATTTAPDGVELGLADRVPVVVAVEVAVPVAVPVAFPVPIPEALPEGGAGVGATLDPVPDTVGVPVAELDGRIYTVAVALLLGYAVGLAVFATTEDVAV